MYSMLGLVVMNGVIQLVLYPFLSRQLGADEFGVVLTLISIVSIMGSTFGTAANYSRMVTHMKKQDSNSDYNIFLFGVAVVSVAVSIFGLVWLKKFSVWAEIGYLLLMIFTVLRYYSDVEFRLNLNYKRFFVFYLLISIGYLIGIGTFYILHSWMITMLIGECMAVLYVVFTGSIYKGAVFKRTEHFAANMKSVLILSGTELIAAVILNADRIILQAVDGGTSVTVFYAATLIGKMVSLISMPLNGVIIGHLSKYNGKLTHSMANAVVQAAAAKGIRHDEMHSEVQYVVAHGIASQIGGEKAVIGSQHFVFEDEGCYIPTNECGKFDALPPEYSHLYLAIGGVLAGVICIADPLREEASEVLKQLRGLGIRKAVMMTGDNDRTASVIAKQVGVDHYYAEVLPEDKANFVEQEKAAGHTVIMLGDGINDSPALSAADVGIAISDGAAIAREIADVTIAADSLRELVLLKSIANGLQKRTESNYRFIMSFNSTLIVLGAMGILPPATSALLHNASTLGVSLKSMTNLLD